MSAARAVHPRDVRAYRDELAMRLRPLERMRFQGSSALEGERRELLDRWQRDHRGEVGWLEAPAELARLGTFEQRLAHFRSVSREYHERGHVAAVVVGLTIPTEVTTYHHFWDDYVKGAITACRACVPIIGAEEQRQKDAGAGTTDIASKGYERRAVALETGWQAGDELSPAERMLSGGEQLKLYMQTVQRARDFMGEVKRECPSVPRPSLPTGVAQAVIMGQLEAAGLVTEGSAQIVGETAADIGEAVKQSAPTLKVLAVAGAVIATALVIKGMESR